MQTIAVPDSWLWAACRNKYGWWTILSRMEKSGTDFFDAGLSARRSENLTYFNPSTTYRSERILPME